MQTVKTSKGAETRRSILAMALQLFRERGYEKTTMRMVADAAGVTVSNVYYYFESKEHLVQAFYDSTHVEHLAVCEPMLENEAGLEKRLQIALRTKIETAEPYHGFAGLLFKTAADPKSPLNPFSDASEDVRNRSTDLMARVVDGSKARVPADLRRELPGLLWLYQMAVILFWIHDDSDGRRRTHRLIEKTAGLVTRLISISSAKLMAPLRKSALGLIEDLRQP